MIKVLFVVADFFQGGAERYAYEIDKSINKNIFEISILCLNTKKNNNINWNRYYDKKHLEENTKIYYIDPYLIKRRETIETKILRKIYKRYKKNYYDLKKISKFLSSFDLVHWMGEYTFLHNLPENIVGKSIINPMSTKFQNPNIYSKFNFDYKYNFISGFVDDEFKHEYSQFKEINHWYFPLLLEIENKENNWGFVSENIKKIGIFTRLDKYKPLDPFLYSFQLLLEKKSNCQLHIFGTGDPEVEGINNILNRLDLRDNVFFRGHQKDMVKTLMTEHIDLSWFQGYNNDRPSGYAGFDVCTTGTPLLCWDFFEKPIKYPNKVFPHYKSLTQFVSKSIEILTNEEKATELSNIQFEYVKINKDIKKHIHSLEQIYLEIINNTNKKFNNDSQPI